MNDGVIERERRALRHIQLRNQRPVLPLENIDGSNSVVDSIWLLQDSPLCWVGTFGIDDEFRAERVLASLDDLYELAMQPWEQFRTVQAPINFSLVYGMSDAAQDAGTAPVYRRWPYGTFPAKIQHEARMRYRELKTTSRFSMEDVPSKWALEKLNPPCDPLDFGHLAGLAATACIVEALEQYEKTIEEFAYVVCKQLPGVPFTWLAQQDPSRLELILAAYTDSGRSGARAREIQAVMLVKNAESWLALADIDDQHQAEIEKVTMRSESKLTAMKAARKNQANTASSAKRGNAKNLTAKMVADHCNANPGKLQKELIFELSEAHSVSKKTISNRIVEARRCNLMQ